MIGIWIPLSGKYGDDKFCCIDRDLYDSVITHKWCVSTEGYPCRYTPLYPHGQLLHEFVMFTVVDEIPYEVDHKNGDRLDARRENLRLSDKVGNAANRGKQKGEYSSKYKGVSFNKQKEYWAAYITVQGKKISLGTTYESEINAAIAYNAAAIGHFGEFAQLNIVVSRVPPLDLYSNKTLKRVNQLMNEIQ